MVATYSGGGLPLVSGAFTAAFPTALSHSVGFFGSGLMEFSQ
jgi:hypothetical protein